ncbi:MAG: outer membrane lipoprotein carrier protein LolA [Gammaproteobacteria bacterium]|nr:MAG: outer membrane lipoprotein carrier protein LolA [Gammaproteobacteria bacterium]
MKLIQSLLLLGLAAFCLLLQAQEQEQRPDGLSQLNGYLEKLDSFEANFQQTQMNSSNRLMDITSGKFVMKRPNRFRWQIVSPYEQLIIADGKSIWSIDNELEQVMVDDIGSSLANSPMMILSQKNSHIENYFSVTKIESKKSLEQFLLTPKDPSSNFEFIQLGFRQGILQTIELHDSLGQATLVTMTNIRNNPIVGNSHFIYQEIPDFDLIDSRKKEPDGD